MIEKAPSHDATHLAQMANDIGNFFRALPVREDAVAGIVNHISNYWTHRMRDKLLAQIDQGGVTLDELPREALKRIAARQAPSPQPPGPSAV